MDQPQKTTTLTIPQALAACIGDLRRMAANLRVCADLNTPVTGAKAAEGNPIACVAMACDGIRGDADALDRIAAILGKVRGAQIAAPMAAAPGTEAEQVAAEVEKAIAARAEAANAAPPDGVINFPVAPADLPDNVAKGAFAQAATADEAQAPAFNPASCAFGHADKTCDRDGHAEGVRTICLGLCNDFQAAPAPSLCDACAKAPCLAKQDGADAVVTECALFEAKPD